MQFHFEVTQALKNCTFTFVYKFNMREAFYPHSGVRNPPAWTNYFLMFLVVIVGPVYCIFQLQMEFA